MAITARRLCTISSCMPKMAERRPFTLPGSRRFRMPEQQVLSNQSPEWGTLTSSSPSALRSIVSIRSQVCGSSTPLSTLSRPATSWAVSRWALSSTPLMSQLLQPVRISREPLTKRSSTQCNRSSDSTTLGPGPSPRTLGGRSAKTYCPIPPRTSPSLTWSPV